MAALKTKGSFVAKCLKIGFFLFFLCYWQGVSSESYSVMDDDQQQVVLDFENLFPASPFGKAYADCIAFWRNVRFLRSRRFSHELMSSEQWRLARGLFIDHLIVLHGSIEQLLGKKQQCLPEDIEFLSGLLECIQSEHADIANGDDESICSAVLIERLKTKLDQLLAYHIRTHYDSE